MGCDIVFKLTKEVKDSEGNIIAPTIEKSQVTRDEAVGKSKLMEIAEELAIPINRENIIPQLVKLLNENPGVRKVNENVIDTEGIVGNYDLATLKEKFYFKEFPDTGDFNPEILLVDDLIIEGKHYKDVIYRSGDRTVYLISKNNIDKFIGYLKVREAILNDNYISENDKNVLKNDIEAITKIIKEKRGKESLKEILLDFIDNNQEYKDLPIGYFGFLHQITEKILNPDRKSYYTPLDREMDSIFKYIPKTESDTETLCTVNVKVFIDTIRKYDKLLPPNEKILDEKFKGKQAVSFTQDELKEVYIALQGKLQEFNGSFKELNGKNIIIRRFKRKFNSISVTYNSFDEFTTEVGTYKGAHICKYTKGGVDRWFWYRYRTSTKNISTFDTIEQCKSDIDSDKDYLASFNLDLRTSGPEESQRYFNPSRDYYVGTQIKILDIPIKNSDKSLFTYSDFSEDHKFLLDKGKTLEDFYNYYAGWLSTQLIQESKDDEDLKNKIEQNLNILKSIVDSSEKAGIFMALADSQYKDNLTIESFNNILSTIATAVSGNKYKKYYVYKTTQNKVYVLPVESGIQIRNPKEDIPRPMMHDFENIIQGFKDKGFNINAEVILDSELEEKGIPKELVDAKTKAFIFNGSIYIIGNRATSSDVYHEYIHLIMGLLKAADFNKYMELLKIYENTDGGYIESQAGRFTKDGKLIVARSDMLEELFVTQFGRYLEGYTSSDVFRQCEESFNKIIKNVTQHQNGKGAYRFKSRYDMFKSLMGIFGNNYRISNFNQTKNLRIASNQISKWIQENKLRQECK